MTGWRLFWAGATAWWSGMAALYAGLGVTWPNVLAVGLLAAGCFALAVIPD